MIDIKPYICKMGDHGFIVVYRPSSDEDIGTGIRYSGTRIYLFGAERHKYFYFIQKYANMITDKGVFVDVIQRGRHDRNFRSLRNSNHYFIDEKINQVVLDYIESSNRYNQKIFLEFGVTKSSSILLYGSPGTGKSSMINYLSWKLKLHVVYIGLEDFSKNMDAFLSVYTDAPSLNQIVVFEDIDVLFGSRCEHDDHYKENFNLLLQYLDGYLTKRGCLNIATTNYIDQLDSALIRSGRFDLKLEMNGLNRETAERMCKAHSVDASILDGVEEPINPADLQVKLMENIKEEENY